MTPHGSYPVTLLLHGKSCLVVGGGARANIKVQALLAAGAAVQVIATEIDPAIAQSGAVVHQRAYHPGEAAGFALVVADSGDRAIDELVAADANAAGVFVNVVDDLAHSSFILPAIARHGSVVFSVGSNGTSPALSSYLRDRCSELLGPQAEYLASILEPLRAELRASGVTSEGRDWHGLIDAVLVAQRDAGDAAGVAFAKERSRSWFTDAARPASSSTTGPE